MRTTIQSNTLKETRGFVPSFNITGSMKVVPFTFRSQSGLRLIRMSLIFSFILLLSFTTGVQAQNANIAAVLQMSPNPSPYLSDWQSRRETVTLTATLDRELQAPVKLMAQVKLNGNLVAETDFNKMPALTLHKGVNMFNAADIIPYSAVSFKGGIDKSAQRLGRLPEGQYEICVFMKGVDLIPPEPIVADCQSFMILDREPVRLVSPANGATFYDAPSRLMRNEFTGANAMTLAELAAKDAEALEALSSITVNDMRNNYFWYQVAKDNSSPNSNGSKSDGKGIYTSFHFDLTGVTTSSQFAEQSGLPVETMQFEWVPPTPSDYRVIYKFKITEVKPGQTPELSIANPPLIYIGSDNTYLKLSDDMINQLFASMKHSGDLKSECKFAWAVQAQDGAGNPVGKNNGWSEVRSFELLNDPDFDLLRAGRNDSTKAQRLMDSFFDVFADPIDWVDAKADSLKKLADSLRSKAARLLDKVIDVEKIKEIIRIIGDSVKAAAPKKKEPCPYVEKKLLRTVVGAWKKVSQEVRHVTVGHRTVAWVDVTWERDVYNVFEVSNCTLEKGHAGAHKMGPKSEVKEKYGTFTEKMSYKPGVPIAPPKPHPTDSLPQE